MTIAIAVLAALLVATAVLCYWGKGEIARHREYAEGLKEVIAEGQGANASLAENFERLVGTMGVLESSLSEQLVARSTEVGIPHPSGAYHTLFHPTSNGRVMMIYLCLETGHIARWHFPGPDVIQAEGERFLKIAKLARAGRLPDLPFMANTPLWGSKQVH